MQAVQKKAWEKGLRATVSVAVLCIALPHSALAGSAFEALDRAQNPKAVSAVVAAKDPRLAHAIKTSAHDKKHKISPHYIVAPVSPSAHYMPAKQEGKNHAVALHAPHLAAPVAIVHTAPSMKPNAQASLPGNISAQAAALKPLAVVAKTEKPAPAPAQEMVLRLPDNVPLPWLIHKKPASFATLQAPPVQTAALHKAAPKPVEKQIARLEPHAHQVQHVVLQPPHVPQTTAVALAKKPEVQTAVISEDHTVWREEKEQQHVAMTPVAEHIVLTPPAHDAVVHEVVAQQPPLTKTLLTRIEIASQQTIEPAITGRAFSEQEIAQMAPAAGEPTILMPPKSVPNPNAVIVSPKLDLPDSNMGVQPSVIVEPSNEVKLITETPATPELTLERHTKAEHGISPESKGILERLPPEPRPYNGKPPKKLSIGHGHGITTKEEDVKKHEAYGMKIAVKRPKMDVFRTLESAYNALIAGDQQYAIAQYKEVLDADPENTTALFGLATTYHRAGQLKMARPLYSQLLEIDPQNVEGLNNFLVLLSDESPHEALIELERLQHSHPSFSPIPAQMSVIYEKDGDYSLAAQKMAEALSLAPENLKFQYNMAIIYDKMGDWEEAAKWYQRLISADARGEKIPGKSQEIQQRLTFIRSNTGSHHS